MIDRTAAEEAVRKATETDQRDAVALVQKWASEAKGPPLSDEAADALASDLRRAISSGWWRDDMSDIRKQDRDILRLQRIAEALRTLQADLPPYVEAWRRELLRAGSAVSPVVPLQATVSLLELVDSHRPFMDAVQPPGRGRPQSLERDMAAHFSRRAREAWGPLGDQTRADAFAVLVMRWLVPEHRPSDAAVAKGRNRRKPRDRT